MSEKKSDKKEKSKHTEKDYEKGKFFTNVKSEFRKIVWPSKESLYKQTLTVIATSLGLGLVVFIYDSVFSALLRLIVSA